MRLLNFNITSPNIIVNACFYSDGALGTLESGRAGGWVQMCRTLGIDSPRRFHVDYKLDLLWISFDTPIRGHEPEELSRSYPRSAPHRIEFHPVLLEDCEGLPLGHRCAPLAPCSWQIGLQCTLLRRD